MKRDEGKFIKFNDDPGVNSLLSESRYSPQNKAKTPAQRKKAARDRARNKLTLDISQSMENQLKSLAAEVSVPVSNLVEYLLVEAMNSLDLDKLLDSRVPTRSMRFEYLLQSQEKQGKQ